MLTKGSFLLRTRMSPMTARLLNNFARPIGNATKTRSLAILAHSPWRSSLYGSNAVKINKIRRPRPGFYVPNRSVATSATANNPLLFSSALPDFKAISPELVVPGISALLASLQTQLSVLEATAKADWQLMTELQELSEKLSKAWGLVSHLQNVQDSQPLRDAVKKMEPEYVKFSLALAQSKPIFDAMTRLKQEANNLDDTQRHILDTKLREVTEKRAFWWLCRVFQATLSGVGLHGEKRTRFNAIQEELASLSRQFQNNVLDSTKAFKMVLSNRVDVIGLPPRVLQQAAEQARANGHPQATAEKGPWLFTLDAPSYVPFMTYASQRHLREQMYTAHVSLASSGKLDNSPVIARILELRQETAEILGFKDYASLVLSTRLAKSSERVNEFVSGLRDVAFPAAKNELAALTAFARKNGHPDVALKAWDVPYWAEEMKQSQFQFNEEELRPYFPLPRVLNGLFTLASKVFGIEIREATKNVSTWHPHVQYFEVFPSGKSSDGKQMASFFLDPYSRPSEKRGGAWMDECIGRSVDPATRAVRLPVAYLCCNQSPPTAATADKPAVPSLMSFREVETLFHEFGHGLQHMLTTVDHAFASGIRGIEWDAVELPSQFMENFCYHKPTLQGLSAHVETGKQLPTELFDKIVAAKTYRAASALLRQIQLASVDMKLHSDFNPKQGNQAVFDATTSVTERTSVLPNVDPRFVCSFSHIFAGGYAAGYYSYKFAEVMAADAFEAFIEAGLDDERAMRRKGRKFRDTILAKGGSMSAGQVYRLFRGTDPSSEALLRQANLLPHQQQQSVNA